MQRRFYTVTEANSILPEIRKQVIRIMKLNKVLDMLEEIEIIQEDDYEHMATVSKMNKNYHKICYRFHKEIEMLTKRGVILRDIDEGLVDFYSLHDGKEIMLCWKIEEPRIQHWHELEDGFSERRHVKELVRIEKDKNRL
ncbi:MAG: DUF2203 domain-containing protein [Candidatus Woesearchaeota archaeon]